MFKVLCGAPKAIRGHKQQSRMDHKAGMFRTTFVGGILFLLPIVPIILLLGKALSIAKNIANPVVKAIGVTSIAGVAAGTLIAIGFLVAVSFGVGLLARTRIGQRTFSAVAARLPRKPLRIDELLDAFGGVAELN